MITAELSSCLRNLVAGVNTRVPLINGQYVTAVNFDNAATTPPFCAVMEEIQKFAPWYSSIHRGSGYKSVLSSDLYEQGRDIVKKFVNADPDKDIVIYTKNTTEAINLLSYKLYDEDRRQVVITTEMEHLSNDLPWRDKFNVEFAAVDSFGRLLVDDLEAKLRKHDGRVGLVAVTGASNVTGYINPVYHIARMAHQYGAKILVDGAQMVPHCPIDMKCCESEEHIDYLVFSGHKMYAPFGIGVLIGPKDTFTKGEPMCKGGGAVKLVSREFIDWDDPPYKDEAGTPNVMGVIALTAAIKTLTDVGMDTIHEYERGLISYAINGLKSVPGIRLYCCADTREQRVSLISFELAGIHHRLLAKILASEAGIAVRSGLFCAHPYVEKLLNLDTQDLEYYYNNPNKEFPGLLRASLGLYNNRSEIEGFVQFLNWVAENKKFLQEKYKHMHDRVQHIADFSPRPVQREVL